MYHGAGSALGWSLTGGTATLNAWSHVVAVWTGDAALLYINSVLADTTNDAGLNGVYNPNTAENHLVSGQGLTVTSPYTPPAPQPRTRFFRSHR